MTAEQRKLYRILKLISLLKSETGRTIQSIAELLEVSDRTVYRYLNLLDEAGFPVDCKPGTNRWFLAQQDDSRPGEPGFNLEEATLLRDLVVSGAHHHPLRDGILTKLYIHSELKPLAGHIVNARVNILLEKLVKAIKKEKQVILKHYHSAHSGEVKDYKVEPFDFTENYSTVLSWDVRDRMNKQFKLERIGEVIILDKPQKFKDYHEKQANDVFGCSGGETVNITLNLNLRSYLLLREEFPRSLPFIAGDREDGRYTFHCPVNGFEGAGRFVMGLIDETEIVGPDEFREYILDRIRKGMKRGLN